MADHGYVVLDAGHITAGTVTVTPAATPAEGRAVLCHSRTVVGKVRVQESARTTAVNGNDLDITLGPKDRAGMKVFWTSYE